MGAAPSSKQRTPARMSKTTQWVKSPRGASGSCTMSAKPCVPSGTPLHSRGGERFSPSQVKREGIVPPSVKAELLSVNMAVSLQSGTGAAGPRYPIQISTSRRYRNRLLRPAHDERVPAGVPVKEEAGGSDAVAREEGAHRGFRLVGDV